MSECRVLLPYTANSIRMASIPQSAQRRRRNQLTQQEVCPADPDSAEASQLEINPTGRQLQAVWSDNFNYEILEILEQLNTNINVPKIGTIRDSTRVSIGKSNHESDISPDREMTEMHSDLMRAHIAAPDRASVREYTTERVFRSTFLPAPSITAVVWARLGPHTLLQFTKNL